MKETRIFLVLLLAVGLIFGLAGCPTDGGDGDDKDKDKNDDSYAQYYQGSYRDNQNGTVTVYNNTAYDMLLFTGEIISTNYLVGGVKAGSNNTVNFSTESDYNVGGYKLLRAVKQTEFDANKDQSRIDFSALITYGEGKKFQANIVSTTDGDYQYTVYNRSRDYGLELRKNSPDGEKVAYMTKGEVRRVIKSATSTELTLYPVWVAFNAQTKSIVTFSPSEIGSPLDVQPKREHEDTAPLYFPEGGQEANIVFPSITLPFATIQVRNNGNLVANFRIANDIRRPESGYTGITSGARESYEIRSEGEGLNLNIAMNQQQTVVPVRFQDEPTAADVVIENGYLYTVTLNLKNGGKTNVATDWEAWLVKGPAIDTSQLLVSQ